MAKRKIPGVGSRVECDLDGTKSQWVLFGFTGSITPPPQERNEVDAGNLDEDLDNTEPGTEARSDLEFVQVWDPSDAGDSQLDAMFSSKVKAYWRVWYPTEPVIADEFLGWVRRLGPEPLVANTRLGRGVTVRRASSLSRKAFAGYAGSLLLENGRSLLLEDGTPLLL